MIILTFFISVHQSFCHLAEIFLKCDFCGCFNFLFCFFFFLLLLHFCVVEFEAKRKLKTTPNGQASKKPRVSDAPASVWPTSDEHKGEDTTDAIVDGEYPTRRSNGKNAKGDNLQIFISCYKIFVFWVKLFPLYLYD